MQPVAGPPPYPQHPPYPPYQPPPPPRPKSSPDRLIVIIALVVVVIAVVVVYPMTQQPNITLSDGIYNVAGGCGLLLPGRNIYTVNFSLANTGKANGFAEVDFVLVGGGLFAGATTDRGSLVYYVPQGATMTETNTVYGDWGCPASEVPDLFINSTWKA